MYSDVFTSSLSPSMVDAVMSFTEDDVIDVVAQEIEDECGQRSVFGKHGLTRTVVLLFKVRCFIFYVCGMQSLV